MFEVAILAALLLLVLGGLAAAVGPSLWRRRIRQRHASQPFPAEWQGWLENDYALYPHLPADLRQKLHEYIQIFLAEKTFEPCGDLREVTPEMRLLVAAQACLLLLGMRQATFYPRLQTILVYPDAYRDSGKRVFELTKDRKARREERLGESWGSGSVVLAWSDVLRGAASEDDGINVTYHEFAHQLDQADSRADGVPPLDDGEDYSHWAGVWSDEYADFLDQVDAWESHRSQKAPLLDPYGAENPAEFFAVSTEGFFEFPHELQQERPALYAELMHYYGLDPARWVPKRS